MAEKITIIDVFRKEVDETTRKIGLFLLSLVPIPLIIMGAKVAYDMYKEWEKEKKGEKK